MTGVQTCALPICGKSEEYYTELLLSSMQTHPYVDVLTHPDIKFYPVNIKRVVETAALLGIAVEFNNANIMYEKTNLNKMKELVEAVRETECTAVISSDAHFIYEIGEDKQVIETVKKYKMPQVNFINSTFELLLDFIEKRRKNKNKN